MGQAVRTLLERIREDLAARRIHSGMQALESHSELLDCLDPAERDAGVLVGYIALWVEAGFAGWPLVRKLLAHFPQPVRAGLPLADYLHLRMAEGLLAMEEEDIEEAIRHFQFVISAGEEVSDADLLAVCNFWIGRALRLEGRYDDALSYVELARTLARQRNHEKTAAVMQITQSWLVFQKGKLREAARLLGEAEVALDDSDDFISRGNIQSAYGRIARREGRYESALEHFEKAIAEYRRRDPRHPNLARSLMNMAFVKRLMAVRLKEVLDRESARRRAGGAQEPAAGSVRAPQQRAEFERLRSEALDQLGEARAIYELHHNHRGIGGVHINYAFLYLDGGELDCAAADAAEALRQAEIKHDYLLMARARILQCMVELAKIEEQIEESPDPSRHAQLAQEYALEAVECARHTQNARLMARAYIWQGLSYSSEYLENRETARQCCDSARSLLKPEGQDYLWEDLQTLRSRLLRSGRVDTVLREWSEGLVGEKTFQQLAEEFAAIIIPKIWEREGRKVSRVAAKLSMSPKKVRRILQDAGVYGGASRGSAAE